MPNTTPLTDAIEALTTYANETTGASDTTLSDAVATLIDGYGGGADISSLAEDIDYNSISGLFKGMVDGTWGALDLHVTSGTNPININFGRSIKGFICYPMAVTLPSELSQNEWIVFNISLFDDDGNGTQTLLWNVNRTNTTGSTPSNIFNRIASFTFENGLLSLVPNYPTNSQYNPFGFTNTYKFIYWWK